MKKAIDTLVVQPDIEVPFRVMCVLGTKTIMFSGNQSCIGPVSDFVELGQTREAIEWLAEQYGGTVSWDSKSQTKQVSKKR